MWSRYLLTKYLYGFVSKKQQVFHTFFAQNRKIFFREDHSDFPTPPLLTSATLKLANRDRYCALAQWFYGVLPAWRYALEQAELRRTMITEARLMGLAADACNPTAFGKLQTRFQGLAMPAPRRGGAHQRSTRTVFRAECWQR